MEYNYTCEFTTRSRVWVGVIYRGTVTRISFRRLKISPFCFSNVVIRDMIPSIFEFNSLIGSILWWEFMVCGTGARIVLGPDLPVGNKTLGGPLDSSDPSESELYGCEPGWFEPSGWGAPEDCGNRLFALVRV